MGGGSIQLARILGIRIGASPSWFVVLFIMIYGLSSYFRDVLAGYSDTTAYVVAVAGAVLFFVSLVLHELGHALIARRLGIEIAGIDLWFFGGIAKLSRDSRSPGEELKVAVAGPAVTLAIVVLCLAAAALASRTGGFLDSAALTETATTPALALLGWLAVVNLFLLAFNLVPAFPLDGGRIARAIAWRVTGDRNRGTLFSARLGQGFSYLLIGFGIYLLITSDAFNGIWFCIMGWFLGQAAKGAVVSSRFSERLGGLTAGDLMDAHPVSVPGDVPVIQAQEEWFMRYRWPWFPVVGGDGRFLGILEEGRLEEALASGRPGLPVAELVEPGTEGRVRVQHDTPVEHLLGAEGLRTLGALMVVDRDERLRGVVTVEQVRRALSAVADGPLG